MNVCEAPWLRGEWVRRDYSVLNGSIRPNEGSACVAYNPFGIDRDDEGASDILEEHTAPDGGNLVIELARLDLDDERAIASFASQWGLLGLILHPLFEQ